jgi:alanyl-tRNA synthetase
MNIEETIVTFPEGALQETARVVMEPLPFDGKWIVVTDVTPFHPIDHWWPDQPSDTGWLVADGSTFQITESVIVAAKRNNPQRTYVGTAIPARRGDADWAFLVGHVVASDTKPVQLGARVTLKVDEADRQSFSTVHSAAHFMALALNAATAEYWKKDVQKRDCFNNPDFDGLAIRSSRIDTEKSTDVYRVGKSIRKTGLDVAQLLRDLPKISNSVETTVNDWLAKELTFSISPSRGSLTEKRIWICDIEGKTATIPCGGTHHLDRSSRLSIVLTHSGDEEITAITTVEKQS